MVSVYLGLIPLYLVLSTVQCFSHTTTQTTELPQTVQTEAKHVFEIQTTSDFSTSNQTRSIGNGNQSSGSNDGVRGHSTAPPDGIAGTTISNGRYKEHPVTKDVLDNHIATESIPTVTFGQTTEKVSNTNARTESIRKVKVDTTTKRVEYTSEENFTTETTPRLVVLGNDVTTKSNRKPLPVPITSVTRKTQESLPRETSNETSSQGSKASLQDTAISLKDAQDKAQEPRTNETATTVLTSTVEQSTGMTSEVKLNREITTITPEAAPKEEQTTSGYVGDILRSGRTTIRTEVKQNSQRPNLHLHSIFQKSPFLSSKFPTFGLERFFTFSPLSRFASEPTLTPFLTTRNFPSNGIPANSLVNNGLEPSSQHSKENLDTRAGQTSTVGTRPGAYRPTQQSTVMPSNINLNLETRTQIPGQILFDGTISHLNSMVQRQPGSDVISNSVIQQNSGSDVISNLNSVIQLHPGSDAITGQGSLVQSVPGSDVIPKVNSVNQHYPGSEVTSRLDSFVQNHLGSDVIRGQDSVVQRHPESDVITSVNSVVHRHPGSDVNIGLDSIVQHQAEPKIISGQPHSSSNHNSLNTNQNFHDQIPSLTLNHAPESFEQTYHSASPMDASKRLRIPSAIDTITKKDSKINHGSLDFAGGYDDLRDDSFYDEYSLDLQGSPFSVPSPEHKADGFDTATKTGFVGIDKASELGNSDIGGFHKFNDEYDQFDDLVEYPIGSDSNIKDYDTLDDIHDDHFDKDYEMGDDDFYNGYSNFDDLDYFADNKIAEAGDDDDDIMDDVDEAEHNHHDGYQGKHQKHFLKDNIWQLSEFPKTDSLSEEMLDDPEDFPNSFSGLGSRKVKSLSRSNNFYYPSRKPIRVKNTNLHNSRRVDDIERETENREQEGEDVGDELEFDDYYNTGVESENDEEDIPISGTGRQNLGRTLQERFGRLINIYRNNLDKGQKEKPVKSFSNVKALLKTYNSLVAMRGGNSKRNQTTPTFKSKTSNPKGNRAKQIRRLERIKRLMRIASERQTNSKSKSRSLSNLPGSKPNRNYSKRLGSKPKPSVYHHPRNLGPKFPGHRSNDKPLSPMTALNNNLFHFPTFTDHAKNNDTTGITNINAQKHLFPTDPIVSSEAKVEKLMSSPIHRGIHGRIIGEKSDTYDDIEHYDDNDDDDDDDFDDDDHDDDHDHGDHDRIGEDYEYEMDEDEREEEDFLAKMFGLQNFRPTRSRISTNAYGVCPSPPIKVENSTVKITTAEGCQIVITFNEQTGVHVGTSRETFGVKVSYREN